MGRVVRSEKGVLLDIVHRFRYRGRIRRAGMAGIRTRTDDPPHPWRIARRRALPPGPGEGRALTRPVVAPGRTQWGRQDEGRRFAGPGKPSPRACDPQLSWRRSSTSQIQASSPHVRPSAPRAAPRLYGTGPSASNSNGTAPQDRPRAALTRYAGPGVPRRRTTASISRRASKGSPPNRKEVEISKPPSMS